MVKEMRKQKFYLSLYILFNLLSFFNTEVWASKKVDFSNFIPASRAVPLIAGSPQAELREVYEKMRQLSSFKKLEERANNFEEYILSFIDKDNLLDQTQFIEEAEGLRKRLEKVSPVLQSHFNEFINLLEYRIDLARIDHQLVTRAAVRGSINHPNFPENVQQGLNMLVGKIFRILQREGGKETAMDIGSGILAHLSETTHLLKIKKGDRLNGLITCAHVLETPKSYHLNGIYFIANIFLESETGLPIGVKKPKSLLRYLKCSPNSLKIDTYAVRRRTGKTIEMFPNNNPILVNPIYWDNDDIVFARFSEQQIKYSEDLEIDFEDMNSNHPQSLSDDERYFAIGYPSCPHYDKRIFLNNKNYPLIEDLGISPLFITSSLAHHQGKTQKQKLSKKRRPKFKKGRIYHEAPAAQGMSGGPLIRIVEEETKFKIRVFGSIMSGYRGQEEGCY